MNKILLMGIFFLFPFIQSCAQSKNLAKKQEQKTTPKKTVLTDEPHTKYTISIDGSQINLTDNTGLKQGKWLIRDTTYKYQSQIPQHKIADYERLFTQHERDSLQKIDSVLYKYPPNPATAKQDTIQIIYVSEGNYSNGNKQGLWKYSALGQPQRSEVKYSNDLIISIQIYDSPNHVYLKAIPNYSEDNVSYEKFNVQNQTIEKGKFPLAFLYATSQRFVW